MHVKDNINFDKQSNFEEKKMLNILPNHLNLNQNKIYSCNIYLRSKRKSRIKNDFGSNLRTGSISYINFLKKYFNDFSFILVCLSNIYFVPWLYILFRFNTLKEEKCLGVSQTSI